MHLFLLVETLYSTDRLTLPRTLTNYVLSKTSRLIKVCITVCPKHLIPAELYRRLYRVGLGAVWKTEGRGSLLVTELSNHQKKKKNALEM